MSELLLDTQSPPATPAAGQSNGYVDSLTNLPSWKDPTGFVRSIGATNFSVAAQAVPAATRTYIAGSQITVPGAKLQAGSCFRWHFNMTKTAAGVAASTLDVAVGTAGTVADTARVSFTKPAGTAVADEAMVKVLILIRSIGANGVAVGEMVLKHNLSATGHALVPVVVVNTVSAAFDTTPAGLIVGLCLTSGASDAITIQMVQAEAWNL